MNPQRFVFNLYQAPGSMDEDEVTYIYATDPIILLEKGQSSSRHKAQRDKFPSKNTAVDDPIFEPSLDWAYCEYIVHRLWAPDERDDLSSSTPAPLGNAPPQGATSRRRQLQLAQLRLIEALDRRPSDDDERLYLFNVIVALEWLPTEQYLRQLEWGFRRASDLLYDVTNGRMAFGQVVFADSDWLDCADVQIMASNRLLPRSWVSGLVDEEKYTPIRAGRGVWNRKPQVAIPWDEPEAYRTLVHEWGHYALGLRDEYLGVVPEDDALRHMCNKPQRPAAPDLYRVVVPQQGITSESLMATPEGNSELSNPIGIPDKLRREHYPRLNMPRGEFAGPGRLPLPLPSFHRLGRLTEQRHNQVTLTVPGRVKDDRSWVYVLQGDAVQPERILAQGTLDARSHERGFQLFGAEKGDTVILIDQDDQNQLKVWRGKIASVAGEQSAHIRGWNASMQQAQAKPGQPDDRSSPRVRLRLPAGISYQEDDAPRGDWSVSVIHRSVDGADERIDQGKLDVDSGRNGFLLRGVEEGDIVELAGKDEQGQPLIWSGTIDRIVAEKSGFVEAWEDVTLDFTLLIDVEPDKLQAAEAAQAFGGVAQKPKRPRVDHRRAEISVHLKKGALRPRDKLRINVFPLGGATNASLGLPGELGTAIEPDKPIDVPALDGHVMVSLGNKLLITTYSQGGGPLTTPHVPTNPITAGSWDGEALLFFDDPDPTDEQRQKNARVRVVTTALHGLLSKLPDGAEARSDAFSIASNEQLRPELKPTLVILNDIATTRDDGDLLIYRLMKYDEKTGAQDWASLPTYVQPGAALTATPLAAPVDEAKPELGAGGGKLIRSDRDLKGEWRTEYYRLYSRPRDAAGDNRFARTSQVSTKKQGA